MKTKRNFHNLYKKNDSLLCCILLCTVSAFIVFAYFILRGNGMYLQANDWNVQQIPFGVAMNRALQEGNPDGWCWNLDLGGSIIQCFSFHNMGSPFYWICLLFEPEAYPYLMGWIYILKYAAAGITAFLYLRRFVSDERAAVLGALLYEFCGSQTVNLLFQFADSIAFFPILLLGLEEMMENRKKKGLFIFAVFINCLVSYFQFIQTVVFLIIYFLFRFGTRDYKKLLSDVLQCLVCGVIGVLMAAVLFVPSVMYILGNSRSGSIETRLFYDFEGILSTLKGMLLPADPMEGQFLIKEFNFDSQNCYLPLTGLSLVFSYLFTRKKSWLKGLLIVLIVGSFFTMFNAMFLLFTQNYLRWWYMLDLMLILASVIVLSNRDAYNIRLGVIVNVLITVAFGGSIYLMNKSGDAPLILNKKFFILHIMIAILGP